MITNNLQVNKKFNYLIFPFAHLTIFLLLSVSLLPTSNAQWTKNLGLNGGEVFFLERYAGAYWAGAESGLYRSTDGQQWSQVPTIGEVPVLAGLADADTLYIVRSGKKAEMLTSVDGGQSWLATEVATSSIENPVFLKKSGGALFFGGIQGAGYQRSKNNGVSFQLYSQLGNTSVFDANGSTIARFNGSTFSISQNGGNSFSTCTVPVDNPEIRQIIVLDSAIMVVATPFSSGLYSAHVTYNLGQSWQPVSFPANLPANAVQLLRSGKRGVLIEKNGQYAYSSDFGQNWSAFTAPQRPRQLLPSGNSWLISSVNGFYRSADLGLNWTTASQGYPGLIAYRIYGAGQRLYAVLTDRMTAEIHRYFSEIETNVWTELQLPTPSDLMIMGFQGQDTLLTYDQISLDGGSMWTYIDYSNVASFSVSQIETHNGKAYILNGGNLQVVPLMESPTAQPIAGPDNNNCTYVLFAGDTLYVVTQTGQIFQQLPNMTDWIPLTQPGLGGSKLYRINGRFFQPRTTDLLYSDDGNNWQVLPTTGMPWALGNPIYITDMVGTDSVVIASSSGFGLIFSPDKGSHWWPFQTGLPDNATEGIDLAQTNGKVYAAMYRLGLWQRTVQTGSCQGLVYRDENQNGVQDLGEKPLADQKVWARQSNNLSLSDSLGRYQLVFDLPSDTVQVVPPITYTTVQPAFRRVVGMQSQDFGLWLPPEVTDLAIFLQNTAAIQPGFDNTLHISVSNAGTTQPNARVGLKLPLGASYLFANPAPTNILADSLSWELDTLSLFSTTDIAVQIQIDNAVLLGHILSFRASAAPDALEFSPLNNEFVLNTTAVGSYDPNAKQVWPGPYISPQQITAGVPLRYTIQFQNTGTYVADKVRLVDTLAADLDMSSLTVTGASHPYIWRVTDGHILEVLFENIQLPDSNTNLTASHGFFSFTIKAHQDLNLGSLLSNRAAIYFDYNMAIFTNKVTTLVSYQSGVTESSVSALEMSILPNPATTRCTVLLPTIGGELSLLNAQGTLLRCFTNCPEKMDLELTGLVPGAYFLAWKKGAAQIGKSMIILR